ncbi:nascent polypeptide-associated complex subunit alpha, muscle-specific form-like [Mastomys coucha]|uniref:nascent polypeptide-associated complex subunit alpha, muscle-specific form-like n=1 Tax=Mastomys coucha TaxID=35658 RepID=UPI001261868B|nr:nascent polypeptide-associated complex subunit alpha, muscle-specific form-like [Mastomys coucha]
MSVSPARGIPRPPPPHPRPQSYRRKKGGTPGHPPPTPPAAAVTPRRPRLTRPRPREAKGGEPQARRGGGRELGAVAVTCKGGGGGGPAAARAKTPLGRGARASRGAEAPGRAERAEPRSPGLRPRLVVPRLRDPGEPPPRPLLPPSGGRRSFWPPPRGLLLTLRKTPDVRGWLSATGGSGYPAPRVRLAASAPRPGRALATTTPLTRPSGDPRPSASSRENTFPRQAARAAGPTFPRARGGPGFPGPRGRRPRTRGGARLSPFPLPASPPAPHCHRTRTPLGLGPQAVPGDVAVQSREPVTTCGLEVEVASRENPSASPWEGCQFHGPLKPMAQGRHLANRY